MRSIRRGAQRLYFRLHRLFRRLNRRLSPAVAVLERRLLGVAPVLEIALPEPRRAYRVLLPVSNPAHARRLARFAAAAAATRNGEVVVLYVSRIGGGHARADETTDVAPVPDAPGVTAPGRQRWEAVRRALDEVQSAGIPAGYVIREADNIGRAIRREARRQDADLIVMGWRGSADTASPVLDATLDAVLEDPPSDVMVVGGRGEELPERILVPFVTIYDAPVALRLAQGLTRDAGCVAALRVVPEDATMADMEEESLRFGELLNRLDAGSLSHLVVRASERAQGILDAIRRGYDGVLMAAPSETFLDHLLFGDTQMRVAAEGQVPVIVVKGRSGPLTYVLRRIWRRLYDALPKLSPEEMEAVYDEINSAAAPRIDFFAMIALSAAIATFGLLLDSPAVIIGAMLVAPLMAAMVGIGLGVVEGDLLLMRRALSATVRGALLAVGVSVAIGVLQIGHEIGPEVLSRTRPTLLDLGVALASGVAGAYAISRKGVQASLAGVAIAAALVPPLSALGIGIAVANAEVALGALLLYVTNLVAIAAAGGVTFLLLGFGPSAEEEEERRLLQRGFATAGGLLAVVVVALGFITWQTWQLYGQQRMARELEAVVRDELAVIPGADLVAVSFEETPSELRVSAAVRLPSAMVDGLDYRVAEIIQKGIAEKLDRFVELDLLLIPTIRLQPQPAATPEASASQDYLRCQAELRGLGASGVVC